MMARALVFLAAAAFSCANGAQQSSHIGGTLEAGSPTATVMMSAGASDPEGWASFLRPSRKGGPVVPWDGRSATSANRDFARPFLTVPPSDHAAAGRDQTSAGQTQSATTPSRTADETEGPVVSGEAATGPTAYEKLRAAISWCESRNQPTVVNKRSGAAGLFQFMPQTWEAVTGLSAPASAYSVGVQRAAFDSLYALRGTKPWNASKSCWERTGA